MESGILYHGWRHLFRGNQEVLIQVVHAACRRHRCPPDPSDGLVEIEAEDKHDFKERLAEIKVPTLVIGGENDCFYPIRETAARIPSARLILYKNAGHMAIMKRQFGEDVLAFLTEGTI